MPSGKKKKRHKMSTHKRKKKTEKEQTQKQVSKSLSKHKKQTCKHCTASSLFFALNEQCPEGKLIKATHPALK